jgi:hypothetical protein
VFVGGQAGEGAEGGAESGGVGGTQGDGGDGAEAASGPAGTTGSAGRGSGGTGASGASSGAGGTKAGSGGRAAGNGGRSGGTACGAGKSCAGGGGTGGLIQGRCPDLDSDGVLDCEETVVQNPSFDLNPDSWMPESNLGLSWSDVDALGRDDSGSLGASNQFQTDLDGNMMVGARQCLAITPGVVYHYFLQASVPEEGIGTQAGLQVIFYDNVQCTGSTLDVAASSLVDGDDWSVASVTYPTPWGAKSAAVRLIVIKPYRQPPVVTLFDNVLVQPR